MEQSHEKTVSHLTVAVCTSCSPRNLIKDLESSFYGIRTTKAKNYEIQLLQYLKV